MLWSCSPDSITFHRCLSRKQTNESCCTGMSKRAPKRQHSPIWRPECLLPMTWAVSYATQPYRFCQPQPAMPIPSTILDLSSLTTMRSRSFDLLTSQQTTSRSYLDPAAYCIKRNHRPRPVNPCAFSALQHFEDMTLWYSQSAQVIDRRREKKL